MNKIALEKSVISVWKSCWRQCNVDMTRKAKNARACVMEMVFYVMSSVLGSLLPDNMQLLSIHVMWFLIFYFNFRYVHLSIFLIPDIKETWLCYKIQSIDYSMCRIIMIDLKLKYKTFDVLFIFSCSSKWKPVRQSKLQASKSQLFLSCSNYN